MDRWPLDIPTTVRTVVEHEAQRVRLDPEDLIIEALRFAPWFQDALARELPIDALALLDGKKL